MAQQFSSRVEMEKNPENLCLHEKLFIRVHSSGIHDGQKVDTTPVPMDGRPCPPTRVSTHMSTHTRVCPHACLRRQT